MTSPSIEIRGMRRIIARMLRFPSVLDREMKEGMDTSLLILQEKVPPYPPPSPGSDYTGTLGKSLGSGMQGGSIGGRASIFETKKVGQGYEGRFGTSLDYAARVIGDLTQEAPWKGRWWTVSKIADRARSKITTLWQGIMKDLAQYLDGKK